ncbi:murein transglycosylase domain-containing protein [Bacteroidales bacterium OttesenSCG-928-K22]|nr:murein transglycosylase domain-containing protein [Bacteroidales bacterium OttesenSCG-928-K22]
MLQKITLLALILVSFTVKAQIQSFEEYEKAAMDKFDKFEEDKNRQFEEYLAAELKAFDEFVKKVSDIWGEDNAIVSTNKDWVEYTDDQQGRSVVDFEEGTAKVELIITDDDAKNPNVTREKIEDQIVRLLTTQGTNKDYDTEFEKREPLSDEPVLAGQVELPTPDNKTVKNEVLLPKKELEQDVKELVESGNVKIETVKGKDGVERKVASFTLALAPDNIKTRAEKFTVHIKHFSDKYNLSPALVCAIIHTESYFNPKAKSAASAYGLMQLVPKSGARDAYKYVYGKDDIPTAQYLYDPQKNIELGTAYMQKLIRNEFKNVKNADSRVLCAIAAYNTGAGNVSKAFTGNTKLGSAIPLINDYNYNELYNYLYKNLPYKETRDYIKKVTERRALYEDWGWTM